MFFLKWFTSSHLEDPPTSDTVTTIDLAVPLPDTVAIMDMPYLVIWKVLKDIDLISIMNLRKVNRAFQHFIDETKLHKIDFQIMRVSIKGEHKIELALLGPARWVKDWKKMEFEQVDGICTVTLSGVDYHKTCEVPGLTILEQFEICVDGILKNSKTPISSLEFDIDPSYYEKSIPKPSIFQSIFGCFKPKKPSEFDTFEPGKPAGDEFLNEINRGFYRILKPWEMTSRKLQIQSLELFHVTLEQAICLIFSIQPEILEDPKVDQILSSEGMKKAERCYLILDLKTVDSDGTVISNGYIRRLGVSVQKLTTPDLLFWKKIILATPHLRSIDFYFKEVSSYEELTSILGPATRNNPDIWFFKGSQKHLKLVRGEGVRGEGFHLLD